MRNTTVFCFFVICMFVLVCKSEQNENQVENKHNSGRQTIKEMKKKQGMTN